MICFPHCYGRRDVDILRQPLDKTTLSAVALFTSPEPKKSQPISLRDSKNDGYRSLG